MIVQPLPWKSNLLKEILFLLDWQTVQLYVHFAKFYQGPGLLWDRVGPADTTLAKELCIHFSGRTNSRPQLHIAKAKAIIHTRVC